MRVVGDESRPLPTGFEGELLVRGPERMLGYLDPEANRAALDDDGWFRTGDVGVLDDGGFVTITGRIKDVINRGGEKFSARDIEDLLGGASRSAPGRYRRRVPMRGSVKSRSPSLCCTTAGSPRSANWPHTCTPPAWRARRRRSHGISSMLCR